MPPPIEVDLAWVVLFCVSGGLLAAGLEVARSLVKFLTSGGELL